MKLKGYSLLEILAVVTIIGILATLSFGSIRAAQIRSRDSKRKADLNTIAQALESYYADRRSLPGQSNNCPVLNSRQPQPWIPNLQSYIISTAGVANTLPVDPKKDNAYFYTYQCFLNDPSKRYRLTATLENRRDPEVNTNSIFTIER